MDNKITVKEILSTYDEISIVKEIIETVFLISMYGKQFLFVAPLEERRDKDVIVYLYNDDGLNIPHIMLEDETFPNIKALPSGKYRAVCLYDKEGMVDSIISYEEKIVDAIDRLIQLLSMNKYEQEREFQKEFMFYWNSTATGKNKFNVYLSNEKNFSEMDVYYCGKIARVIERGMSLSDIDERKGVERKWKNHLEDNAYYIPILDNREIIPPHRGYNWTIKDIRNIVYAKQIEHIGSETYKTLKNTISGKQNFILVFGMKLNNVNIVFVVKIICKRAGRYSLLEKILDDSTSVETFSTERKDYLYLNEQIGNDKNLLKMKVLVIGAGSLGSYVASEMVKNGATNLKIYDGDKLEDANICRWAYGGIGRGNNKASALATLLNFSHPEISVVAIDKNIDEKTLIKEMSQVDMIVSTVGNSDIQLEFNRALKDNGCAVPVIFAWLEAGGAYSHILVVNYKKKGCFECLYTAENGELTNNRSQKNNETNMESSIVRNGCGGTRAAYGTATILRTTAALMETIGKIQEGELKESVLLDISSNGVKVSEAKFPREVCRCCGCMDEK